MLRPTPACCRVSVIALLLSITACSQAGGINTSTPVYTYRVVNTFPHDASAFTQGLVFDDGIFYEGTGLRGHSSLRKLDYKTKDIKVKPLPDEYFGEGIALHGDKIYQLTWQAHTGFVYDKKTFELLRRFDYPNEGWGLTSDGTHLIMSNGGSWLYFLDPENFKRVRKVQVKDGRQAIKNLNELEYVKGEVYANVWESDRIARIDPQTGSVIAWIDLSGLLDDDRGDPLAVLNGIAYDHVQDRLFVTGKRWPTLFEIEVIPTD